MTAILQFRMLLLVVVAVTQIFSSSLFVPGGEGFGGSAFRFVLVILGGLALITSGLKSNSDIVSRGLWAGGILFAYMLISMSWSDDIPSGARQMAYLLASLIMIYVLDFLITNEKDFLFFSRLLVVLGVIVALLSFYELTTGIHWFQSEIQLEAERDLSLRYIAEDVAWFSFGNPNDLAVHVIFCCLVAFMLMGRGKTAVIVATLFGLGAAYLANRLGARLAMLAFAIFILIYLVGCSQSRARTIAIVGAAAAAFGALLVLVAVTFSEQAEFIDVSTFIRLQLVGSGMEMASRTLLLGIGVGGFESEMWASGLTGRTYGIVNPHNAMARMLAENGIIGVTLFGYLLFGPLIAVARAPTATRLAAATVALCVAMPLLLSGGSDPLSSSSMQLAIAFSWIAARFASQPSFGAAGPRTYATARGEQAQLS